MKGKKVLVLLVPVLVLSMLLLVPAAIAIGPASPVLDTPSGVHNVWSSTGYFNHWITASRGGGKMNNAIIVGPPPTGDVKLTDLLANKAEYENMWIYFSQKLFLAFLKASGVSDPEAEANKYPDGIYWHFVYVG